MKRTIYALVPVLACIFMLTGCRCSHTWDPATCSDAKTCQSCGVTDGEALGHSWKDATCSAPKTCETCKKTEGKPLKHTWHEATCAAPKTCANCGLIEGEALPHTWIDANCDTPKTCSACTATEGAPLGHIWQTADCDTPQTCTVCDAVNGEAPGHSWIAGTCDSPKFCSVCKITEGTAPGHKWIDATTEAPKTCTACGQTEGDAIKTDPRFTTVACQMVFGTWKHAYTSSGEAWGVTDYDGEFVEYVTYTFQNNGALIVETGIDTFDEYKAFIAYYTEQKRYAAYAQKGLTKAEADAACKATFGVTVPELAAGYAATLKKSDYTHVSESVYYVKDGQIYIAESWSDLMEPTSYRLENGKLILVDTAIGEDLEFSRT
jgi:hypothetical protein